MNERLREEIALFRHGVIRDFVADPLAKGEKQRLLDELAERDWEIPGEILSKVVDRGGGLRA